MKGWRRAWFFTATLMRVPIDGALIGSGFGRLIEGSLRRRLARLKRDARTPERSFALERTFEALQRLEERRGRFEESGRLVEEQAASPWLVGLSHYAYLRAAHRTLERRPDLARGYLKKAKDSIDEKSFDVEVLDVVPSLEEAIIRAERS